MDIKRKFIAITAGIFALGLAAGIVCGIGMGGTFVSKDTKTAETKAKVWDLRAMKDTALYPNFPVALWDGEKGEYRSSQAIEELYGTWSKKEPFTLSGIKSRYALVVFESPLCPFCFAMHAYLRDIRRNFSDNELEIIVINPPALSEKSAADAVAEIRKYLSASDEETKSAYITKDRNSFRFASIAPRDSAHAVQMPEIAEVPAMVLVNRDLDILYISEGYPVSNDGQARSFFTVWNSLLATIRMELESERGIQP